MTDGPETHLAHDNQLHDRLLANVRLLPSGTSLRFAVLVVMIIASTGSIYGHLALLVQPSLDAAFRQCVSAPEVPAPAASGPRIGASGNRALDCGLPYAPTIAFWSLLGIVLVAMVSLILYAAAPWWIVRSIRQWTPLGKGDGGQWLRRPRWLPAGVQKHHPYLSNVAIRIDELADRYGLRRDIDVMFLIDWTRPWTSDAQTFGTRRRAYIRLDAGLVLRFSSHPDHFTAVLLHELAHVSNRDNRPTYLTFAAWRAFAAVVLAPYLILSVEPRLISALRQWRPQDLRPEMPEAHVLAAATILAVVVYLSRLAVARVRETHADVLAGCHDPDRTLRAILQQAKPRRAPTLLRYHPRPDQRLAALDDPKRLYAADPLAMFGAGLALGLFAVNLNYGVSIVSLSSWLGDQATSGRLRETLAGHGRTVDGLGIPLALLGPTTVLTLAMISWLAAVTAWRTALAGMTGRANPLRRSVWHLVLPLVCGMVLGEPLSVIYADAGTLGVFDTTLGRQITDVAASVTVLTIIVAALFVWARECAAVWLPVVRGGLLRMCAITAAVGTLGGFSVFLTWFTVHNTAALTEFHLPAALPHTLAGWPAAKLILGSYASPDFLPAMPFNAVLIALPCLMVAVAAVRRPRTAPPSWLPTESADLDPVIRSRRPRVGVGRAIVVGLIAAVLTLELGLVLVELLRTVVGERNVISANTVGGVVYLGKALMLVIALGAAIAACIAARARGEARFSVGLLAAFVTVSVATLVAPFIHFIGTCEAISHGCITEEVYGTTYGGMAAMTPVNAAIFAVPLLLIGGLLTGTLRSSSVHPQPPVGTVHRFGIVSSLSLMMASLAIGSWVFIQYYL